MKEKKLNKVVGGTEPEEYVWHTKGQEMPVKDDASLSENSWVSKTAKSIQEYIKSKFTFFK